MNCPICNRKLNSIGVCAKHGFIETHTDSYYATLAIALCGLSLALAFLWVMVHLSGLATG